MSIRVHDLAKHCGLTNKEMVEKLRAMNYPVKSHSSTVDKITAESIEKEYGYVPPAPEPAPKPAEVPAPTPVVASAPKVEVAPAKAPAPPAPKPEIAAPSQPQVILPRPA